MLSREGVNKGMDVEKGSCGAAGRLVLRVEGEKRSERVVTYFL